MSIDTIIFEFDENVQFITDVPYYSCARPLFFCSQYDCLAPLEGGPCKPGEIMYYGYALCRSKNIEAIVVSKKGGEYIDETALAALVTAIEKEKEEDEQKKKGKEKV